MAKTYPILQWRAAVALDRTHAIDNRGPRTAEARKLVAAWLDDVSTYSTKVRHAVNWLEKVAEQAAP